MPAVRNLTDPEAWKFRTCFFKPPVTEHDHNHLLYKPIVHLKAAKSASWGNFTVLCQLVSGDASGL